MARKTIEARENKAKCDMKSNEIVQSLSRIFTQIDENGYIEQTRATIAEDIRKVADWFGISDVSAALLAAMVEVRGCDDDDLSKYLNCTGISMLGFRGYMDEMESKGVIDIISRISQEYCPTHAVRDVLVSGSEFHPIPQTGLSPDEFYERLSRFARDLGDDVINVERFSNLVDSMVRNNPQIVLSDFVTSSELWKRDFERRALYIMCQNYVDQGDDSVPVKALISLAAESDSRRRINRNISSESTWLQTNGYVAFACEDGMSDSEKLQLTDKAKAELLFDVEISDSYGRFSHQDLVGWKTIRQKDLFFNDRENEQIGRLDSLLDDENFRGVQRRLTEMGMRSGFNAIFYGGPGTGKTACVFELARRTGRDIFCVDMSKLKSKWVGDSEKSVKGLFAVYRKICRKSVKTPILLFNEADAIFSRRIENVNSSVDQMMNSIQNIILQEMEEIQGILVATTNMATNLDPAFERRFIFKIEFSTPDEESRARIWKSQIPNLADEVARRLAHGYTFSGGNIENVARKSTIDYVLSGSEPEYDTLARYCDEELISSARASRVGF